MITGFNTDVEHEGVTYHVQTEDKGLDTPLILSLVYVGGEILASKRAPYDDLIQTGFSETTLVERLQRQHKLICAAIKSGRVEDLKRLGEREVSAAATKREKKSARVQEEKATKVEAEMTAKAQAEPPAPAAPPPSPQPLPSPPSSPPPAPAPVPASPVSILEMLTDGNVPIVPDEAIRVPVFEILPETVAEADETPPAAPEHFAGHDDDDETSGELYLKLLDDEGEFRAGQIATIRIYAGRGKYGQHAAQHADVTVKVLGTTFRPLLLSTRTNDEGVAVVRAILPRFTSGRAAILIRVVAADGDQAELRRIIHQA